MLTLLPIIAGVCAAFLGVTVMPWVPLFSIVTPVGVVVTALLISAPRHLRSAMVFALSGAAATAIFGSGVLIVRVGAMLGACVAFGPALRWAGVRAHIRTAVALGMLLSAAEVLVPRLAGLPPFVVLPALAGDWAITGAANAILGFLLARAARNLLV